ncbi:hypothetical protein [Nannocystis sp. SCPEA4]|uniref:hypothetical protein n=1 Tax=Nannocystis sp. SCPEA4 TaxID=2996787 RepID=UPI0022711292|nr:hypothetical protein [Nannocystis sp. SCPEA4]MCY1061227.1 hypothetical protein [Nannocystis sp. SCPEA4]
MESSTYRSLAFLFSLGTLPVACKPESHDTTDGGTGGTSDTTDGATSTASPTTSTGSTTADDSTTGPGTSEGTDTTGPGTSEGTDTTGGALDACEAYVAYALKCDPEAAGTEAELLAYCTMWRNMIEASYGPTCLALHDAVNQCLAASDCEDPDACEAEMDAANGCLPEAGAACMMYATKQTECYGEPVPSSAEGCQAYINSNAYYAGAPCGSALEEWYACLADLPCPEFQMRTGCDAEQEKVDEACAGG